MSLAYRVLYRLGKTPWEDNDDTGPLAEIVTNRPPGRALDAGCGTGRHAVALAEQGWTVTGVDAVPRALTVARDRAQGSRWPSPPARRHRVLETAPAAGPCSNGDASYRRVMANHIKRREDVNPDEGTNEHGDVTFADPYSADEMDTIKAGSSEPRRSTTSRSPRTELRTCPPTGNDRVRPIADRS